MRHFDMRHFDTLAFLSLQWITLPLFVCTSLSFGGSLSKGSGRANGFLTSPSRDELALLHIRGALWPLTRVSPGRAQTQTQTASHT